jgi:HK97 family phage portal protein
VVRQATTAEEAEEGRGRVSLLHKRDLSGYYGEFPGATASQVIPPRSNYGRVGMVAVTSETALRHSAVFACLRLRANLISTMPVDSFRKLGGVQIETTKLPILVNPGGDRVDIQEWLYSSQFDLDRSGNAFGLITERNGFGLPNRIDLVPCSEVAVRIVNGRVHSYRIGMQDYDPADVWHEKQYTIPGLHVGLSPIAYAAWSIGEYLSINQFALNWFGNNRIPAAMLKNTAKTITEGQATSIKERFKASVEHGDLFVTGQDWTYDILQAEQQSADWIQAKDFSIGDIARFLDCPGDLIDAAVRGDGSITYANVTQRNLQLLIMHLGPAIVRRETALSRLLPQPRYVKFNTDALLRMDHQTRAQVEKLRIDARLLAPSEGRALENLPPFTEAQLAEFDRFWPPKAAPAPKVAAEA